jgi:hypothetical protein
MFLKYFRTIICRKMASLTQNANIFAENWQKSPKITSTTELLAEKVTKVLQNHSMYTEAYYVETNICL